MKRIKLIVSCLLLGALPSFSVTLSDALDNDPMVWETYPVPQGWFCQTNVTHDGEDAAQSGEVGDWDTSWMWMTNSIIGPAQVKFWWKTDASSDDYLGAPRKA
jgi:hypothetical protein